MPKTIPAGFLAAIAARADQERARLKALRPENSFSAASLSCWLVIADIAGVEAIPARKIGDLSVDLLCAFQDAIGRTPFTLGEHQAAFDELAKAIEIAEAGGEMVRADMCAGMDVKVTMADGDYPARPAWSWDDPRVFDLISDDGRSSVPLLARPWVEDLETVDVAGKIYPVEFRVFFGGDAEDGAVSAYYPQAPLSDAYQVEARLAKHLAEAMIRACRHVRRVPWMPRYGGVEDLDRERIHCTLDFALHKDGRLLFLEAGPAHFARWGAHPCCFQGRKPEGVAMGVLG